MTELQKQAIRKLSKCTMMPGTWEKRFCRDMAAKLYNDEQTNVPVTLTAKQDAALVALVHRFRRQHKACECAVCMRERAAIAAQGALEL